MHKCTKSTCVQMHIFTISSLQTCTSSKFTYIFFFSLSNSHIRSVNVYINNFVTHQFGLCYWYCCCCCCCSHWYWFGALFAFTGQHFFIMWFYAQYLSHWCLFLITSYHKLIWFRYFDDMLSVQKYSNRCTIHKMLITQKHIHGHTKLMWNVYNPISKKYSKLLFSIYIFFFRLMKYFI